jgi:oligoxyloglucan reducing-end-specific cellobiohydrolase
VDNGAQWQPFPSCAANVNTGNGGTISVDAGDAVLMWTPPYSGVTQFSLDRGTTWTDVTGLPATTPVYADKVRPFVFYAYANGNFYSTIVNGSQKVAAFAQVNATELPASSGCYGSGCGVVTANFAKAADLWLPLGSNGLYHSLDGGVTWIKLGKVAYANSVAVGAASPTSQYESVFLYGEPTAGSPMAIYRSDDNGSTWVRINDDAHQYGGPTLIQADPRVYGRVYLGMNGRGIIYGDIAQ